MPAKMRVPEFESAFNYSPIGMALICPQGRFLRVNRSLQRITGYSVKELLELDFQTITHPEDLHSDLKHLRALMESESESYQTEKRYIHKSGEVIWVLLAVSLVRNEDGSPKCFFSQVQNIQLRKQAESELLKTLQFLDSIIENIPNMVFIKDASQLRFVRFNKAGEQLLGMDRVDLIGKNDYDFFPKDQADFFTQKDREVLSNGKLLDIPEEPIDTINGKRILHTKKIPIKINNEYRYLLGISEDITDLRQAQMTILQSAKATALGQMAGGIAHEINNPLAILKMVMAKMQKRIGKTKSPEAEIAGEIERVDQMVDRITNIVRSLKAICRNEEHDKPSIVPLQSIVEDTLGVCGEKLKSLGIDIQVPRIPAKDLHCRPGEISQILYNLIYNASDAIKILTTKWIRLEFSSDSEKVTIKVIDSGGGISEEIQEQVMEPFFTTKPVGQGTGLGLSVSASLAESNNGRLFVDKHAANTTFVLEVPLFRSKRKS